MGQRLTFQQDNATVCGSLREEFGFLDCINQWKWFTCCGWISPLGKGLSDASAAALELKILENLKVDTQDSRLSF